MDKIKVKIKSPLPADEVLEKRKNFNESFRNFQAIKASYAKIAAIWGAAVGMTAFLCLGISDVVWNESNQSIIEKGLPITTTEFALEQEKQPEVLAPQNRRNNEKIEQESNSKDSQVNNILPLPTTIEVVNSYEQSLNTERTIAPAKEQTSTSIQPMDKVHKINIKYVPKKND